MMIDSSIEVFLTLNMTGKGCVIVAVCILYSSYWFVFAVVIIVVFVTIYC